MSETSIENHVEYQGMTVAQGVVYIRQQLRDEREKELFFHELHDFMDANTLLPANQDCGKPEWLEFANAVITAYDWRCWA